MTELSRIVVRRSAKFGVAALAATALMGLGAGTAAAGDLVPRACEASQGPKIDGGVRTNGIQGELRSAGQGQVLAQGTVDGDNSHIVGKADPNGDAVDPVPYGGALVDGAGTTAMGPWYGYWLNTFPNPSCPGG